MLLPLELKLCRTFCLGEVVCVWVSTYLLGKGPILFGLRHTCRVQPGGTWCMHFRQSVSGMCCLLKTVYAEWWGRDMVPANSFVLRDGSLHLLLSEKHYQKSKYSPLCPRYLSDHHFDTVCLWVVCLPGAAQHMLGSIPGKPDDF